MSQQAAARRGAGRGGVRKPKFIPQGGGVESLSKAFWSSTSGIEKWTFNTGQNKFAMQFTLYRKEVANYIQCSSRAVEPSGQAKQSSRGIELSSRAEQSSRAVKPSSRTGQEQPSSRANQSSRAVKPSSRAEQSSRAVKPSSRAEQPSRAVGPSRNSRSRYRRRWIQTIPTRQTSRQFGRKMLRPLPRGDRNWESGTILTAGRQAIGHTNAHS